MARNLSSKGRRSPRPKSKQRKTLNLQKPSGAIGPRVKRVGGNKFAIVCVEVPGSIDVGIAVAIYHT